MKVHISKDLFVHDHGPLTGIVNSLVAWLLQADCKQTPYVAFAMHIGALRHAKDRHYTRSLEHADLIYADGISVALLARLAGSKSVVRVPTTDLAPELLQRLSIVLGRPPRLGIVGGRPGQAADVGRRLANSRLAECVYSHHGYAHAWDEVLSGLNESGAEVLLVGMGCPREMIWTHHYSDALPRCLVLTCGGLLGFLDGTERRAPNVVRRLGLEWTWRLGQSPRRLSGRYIIGAVHVFGTAISIIGRRLRSSMRSRANLAR